MNIAFYTETARGEGAGSSIMRATWPAQWINRYTEHLASVFSSADLRDPQHRYGMKKYDVFVFHKQHPAFREIATWIRKTMPDKVIVFDTDDYEHELFDTLYPLWWFQQLETEPSKCMPEADGYTVASYPLLLEYSDKPCVLVENGFDLWLIENRPIRNQYFNDTVKIAYGGGITHTRDLSMLLKTGVLQELCDTYDVDFYVYGVLKHYIESPVRFKRGGIYSRPGVGINDYIEKLYGDATALFCPLVQDRFNDYRSTLKLVEAGVSGKTIVASNVETYRHYLGRDSVTLVDNTPSEWYYALERVITSPETAITQGEANRKTVEQYYNAEYLTKIRIDFFTTLLNQK